MADWLATKFGPKYIDKLDSNNLILSNKLGLSSYKFRFEKTDKFFEELKQKLLKAKNNEEFKELAKCVPEIKLRKKDLMDDQSGKLLYHFIREFIENFDMKYLMILSKNFNGTFNSKKFGLKLLLSLD